jgi:hypothetical protein
MLENGFQLTVRQKRIKDGLMAIDENIAEIFESAFKVLQDPLNHDRFSQSAHSLREVSAMLSRVKGVPQEIVETTPTKNAESKDKMVCKLKVRFALEKGYTLQVVQPEIDAYFKKWNNVHRFLVSVAHHGRVIEVNLTEDVFISKVNELEDVLDYIIRPSSLTISEIDRFFQIEKPTEKDVNDLLTKIAPSSVFVEYFFSKLSSDGWLDPLRERGVFVSPQDGISRNGSILFPIWWPSVFLKRMAGDHEDRVIEIILEMNDTDNFRVHSDLIEAALNMTAIKCSMIVPLVIQWIRSRYPSLVLMRARELCEKLIGDDTKDSAFQLLAGILALGDVDDTKMPVDSQTQWGLEQLADKVIPKFFNIYPLETLVFLCSTLVSHMKHLDKETEFYSSYSYIWRPAIEDHEQNSSRESFDNILIDTIRDGLSNIAINHPNNLRESIDILESNSQPIFQRLKIYTLKQYPDLISEDLFPVLSNRDLLESPDSWHEMYHLLEEKFSSLPGSDKERFFQIAREGLRRETITNRCKKLREGETEDTISKEMQAHYLRRILTPIREFLPEDLASILCNLEAPHGPLEYPDFAGGHIVTNSGSDSSKDIEKLKNLNNAEIIALFEDKSKKPFQFGFDLESSLERFVSSDMNRFVDPSLDLSNVPVAYIVHILQGTMEAIKPDASLNWSRILSFIDKLVSHDWDATHPKMQALYSSNSVYNASIRIVDLYRQNKSDLGLRNEAWAIIKKILVLCVYPRINNVDEMRKEDDFVARALNDCDGMGVDLLVKYLLWTSHIGGPSDKGKMEDEARLYLEEILNLTMESPTISRTAIGIKFVQMYATFSAWTKDKLDVIFPDVNNYIKSWKMTWEGYVIANRLYRDVFIDLRQQYSIAVREIDGLTKDAKNKTILHLVLAYLYGYENWDDSSLKILATDSSPEIRGHVLREMGLVLGSILKRPDSKGVEEIIERCRKYWDWRLQMLETIGENDTASIDLEMGHTYDTFVNLPFLEKEDLFRLKKTLSLTSGHIERPQGIIEKLIEAAGIDDITIIAILIKITKAEYHPWEKDYWKKDLLNLLGVLRLSDDEKVQQGIKLVAEISVRQGFLEYEEFCKS